jgi:ABC-type transporter Mla maintaining outer membrane lipid asymmetry ATPase subunit MlaF
MARRPKPPPAPTIDAATQPWIDRWRLVLGKQAERHGITVGDDPRATEARDTIDFVFDDSPSGGPGDSQLTVPRWIDAVTELFPRQAKEVLERELIARRGIAKLLDEPKLLDKVEPSVELVNVYKTFGKKPVLRGVNLPIYPKKTTVLIGSSGSGKSVIIKHIMGLFKPDSGEIRVFGKNIVPLNELEMNEVRQNFGLLFQHAALLDWLTVAENVAFPLRERTKTPNNEIRDLVDEMLVRTHIADIKNRMPGEISEGQKKRVGLARAMIMKPKIMIYDEPTTGQDPLRTRDIDNMIQETQAHYDITSIVISHDMASTFRIAHMIALLNRGEIAAYGTPEQVRASPNAHVQNFIHAGSVETH